MISSSFMNWLFLFQLPIYLVVALGCYGLFMVGFGLMFFPTCPREAVLLQQVSYFNVRLNCRTLETSWAVFAVHLMDHTDHDKEINAKWYSFFLGGCLSMVIPWFILTCPRLTYYAGYCGGKGILRKEGCWCGLWVRSILSGWHTCLFWRISGSPFCSLE